jgi:hypothetical protein
MPEIELPISPALRRAELETVIQVNAAEFQ